MIYSVTLPANDRDVTFPRRFVCTISAHGPAGVVNRVPRGPALIFQLPPPADCENLVPNGTRTFV